MIQPKISLFSAGKSFKALRVEGVAGACMPEHSSTMEAVVTILSGKARLDIADESHELEAANVFVIPAGVPHSLVLVEDTLASVVMPIESEIKFA